MRFWGRVKTNSLWLIGSGLMLASSGLDGIYMGKWMPDGIFWLGLVLNTMSDVANQVLMYWFGRLRQSPKNSKRYRLASALLPAEMVAVLYSWFFSWRQLRMVLPAIEPEHWRWVAPIAAGFIPLLLAFIGYAQSLLAGKLDEKPVEPAKAKTDQLEMTSKPAKQFGCPLCIRTFGSQAALNAHMRVHKATVVESETENG